jgi:ABC-2 type transport system permease protein
MPQMGLLLLLLILPLQMLSGGMTPFDSMPEIVQNIMQFAPTSHFVSTSQAVLYRGAGFSIIWPDLLANVAIGSVFFLFALALFRKSLASV